MPCIGSIERAERRVVTRLEKDGITTNLMGSYSPGGIRIPILYTIIQKSVTRICIIEWLLLSLQTKYKRA